MWRFTLLWCCSVVDVCLYTFFFNWVGDIFMLLFQLLPSVSISKSIGFGFSNWQIFMSFNERSRKCSAVFQIDSLMVCWVEGHFNKQNRTCVFEQQQKQLCYTYDFNIWSFRHLWHSSSVYIIKSPIKCQNMKEYMKFPWLEEHLFFVDLVY